MIEVELRPSESVAHAARPESASTTRMTAETVLVVMVASNATSWRAMKYVSERPTTSTHGNDRCLRGVLELRGCNRSTLACLRGPIQGAELPEFLYVLWDPRRQAPESSLKRTSINPMVGFDRLTVECEHSFEEENLVAKITG
jgi:hypothetical protein